MGLLQCFTLLIFLVILCGFSVQLSAGFDLLSLKNAASAIFKFKDGRLDRSFHRNRGLRLSLRRQDLSPLPTSIRKRHDTFAAAPHFKAFHSAPPPYHHPTKATYQHKILEPLNYADTPSTSPHFRNSGRKQVHTSASAPLISSFRHHHRKHKYSGFTPDPYDHLHPPASSGPGPSISPYKSPVPSSVSWAPVPSPIMQPNHLGIPTATPTISPTSSSLKGKKRSPPPLPVMTLPPPPPNHDCSSLTCTEPLTYTPPGSPCGCVWPIQVEMHLSVTLYTFFPLVSELAKEIASGVSLNRSQVRIMGANAVNQQLEKTIVLINLVPADGKFDATTAFTIYQKFWKRAVFIETSLFGAYEMVYVRYPGLPPSPPSHHSSSATIDDLPVYPGNENNGRTIKPLGVDVSRMRKNGIARNMIIVIVLSSFTAFVVCMGFIWLLLLKCGCCAKSPEQPLHILISSQGKTSGGGGSTLLLSRPTSKSLSFSSSILAYTGTAKVFSTNDIERATNNFNTSRVLGEGGFGLVYSGILDDGREVAVKVLKRDDRQGGREFLAEVEMLSRLHHRNLVKLIGICTEENCRCLVYELVPNGSVESHLHGIDKEASPLDWYARMKIALGAARGLAYLHEDSSPRVIHRDFKSSNILLEHDFTPKVSDFGLARTALDEGNRHISTHVMGTFGYLAPEYAMTGHLLVKSDVYSYGVVLLELLSGRKPVDLSQPSGQENLVAWARPLLTTKEGLETIIDPAIESDNIPFDSISKVAAIASMCVQPEVSHRPFMGEVVQALKLVCDEFDETREPMSRSCSHDNLSVTETSLVHKSVPGYDSPLNVKTASSASDLKSTSARYETLESESFRRQFNSAPLKMGRKNNFWKRLRVLSSGSMSEHSYS
ncbi:receptor-like serine/threonine-protein kinase ALE2 [Nicotiana tabacum]|uniref:Receptor-like serine/threonine-protein kinase ALE2 n=1 Tax=Nicotiana tabacum TaxID=4097 RepID=A0A1S4BQA9_TOBAC|nr:PREDICTED: receptor-like serine/threonine-protein kinase ALE2 [Nicotiana tabacum]